MPSQKEARERDITSNNRSLEASLPAERVKRLPKRNSWEPKTAVWKNSIAGRQQGAKAWLRTPLLNPLCLRQLPPCYLETDSKAKRLVKCPKSENIATFFKKGASNEVPGRQENAV